jgi:hypothetical protein
VVVNAALPTLALAPLTVTVADVFNALAPTMLSPPFVVIVAEVVKLAEANFAMVELLDKLAVADSADVALNVLAADADSVA